MLSTLPCLYDLASAEDMDQSLEAVFKQADIFNSADIISTVEFDHTGNYLATGDKGGRVVLFERNETVRCPKSPIPTKCQADVWCIEKNL
jgi:hypothetical protein